MKNYIIVGGLFIKLFLLAGVSHALLLGPAADYNAFVADNYGNIDGSGNYDTHNSDAQGRVAAGGDVNVYDYSVGLLSAPAEYSLVSGGTVDYAYGSISNGGVFADGDIRMSNVNAPFSLVANGSIAAISGTYGPINDHAGLENPLDFTGAFTYLKGVSDSLSKLAPNGTTSVASYASGHQITLTGTGSLNIFDLDGSLLTNTTNFNLNMGNSDIAIVNVSGNVIDSMSDFWMAGADGKENNVLYNFYEADFLSIHNFAVQGSVLAPYADVTFNSGHMDGTLIANSFRGTGQLNLHPFEHDIDLGPTPTPEPGTFLLLGSGLMGLGFFGRKIRKA